MRTDGRTDMTKHIVARYFAKATKTDKNDCYREVTEVVVYFQIQSSVLISQTAMFHKEDT